MARGNLDLPPIGLAALKHHAGSASPNPFIAVPQYYRAGIETSLGRGRRGREGAGENQGDPFHTYSYEAKRLRATALCI